MQYTKSRYGANPHGNVNPNDDHGWGGYEWPEGVPAGKLATLKFHGKLGTVTLVGRKELMPLVGTLMRITEEKYGYYFHPGWCWSYENRPVTGSTTVASNHSKGKAFDFNAPENPYSYTWQTNIPPAVVKLWERHGFYWGGRYTGQPTDPMHFEFCLTPAQVRKMLNSAKRILRNLDGNGKNPSTPPKIKPGRPDKPKPKPTVTAKGVTVKQVQQLLNRHGYRLKVDGIYGPKTRAAVTDFQRHHHLKDDGIAGPKTLAKLNATNRPAPAVPRFPLKPGQYYGPLTEGNDSISGKWRGDTDQQRAGLKRWQHRMKVRGWTINPDGLYGPQTRSVCIAFQREKGLTPDGRIGPKTWRAAWLASIT